MKKGYRAIFIASAILIGTGIVATASGLLMGASFREENYGIMKMSDGKFTLAGEDKNNDNAGNNSSSNAKAENRQAQAKESYTDVTSIDLDIGAAEVIITEGEGFTIETTGRGPELISKVEHGRWTIETEDDAFRIRNNDNFVVYITLPKDYTANEMTMDIGMGTLSADTLRAKKISMEAGMGTIRVEQMEAGESDLVAGMGAVIVKKGKLTGEIELECGMGQIKVEIVGKESDYGGSYEVGMGGVQVGSRRGAGVASTANWEAATGNRIVVDGGMGQVEVTFTA